MSSLAIAVNDLRVLRRDSIPLLMLIVMPLIIMPFVKAAFHLTMQAEGVEGTNGAEQAVPGMQVMFGFYLASQVSFGFYREHAWATWDRLRASPASASSILLGKLVVPLFEAAIQFIVLFGLGGLLLQLHVRGPWVQLPMVAGAFSLCLVALGLAVTAACRTVLQVNAIINISALLFACLGGALVPGSLLPHWAAVLSPLVPTYWAMTGFRRAILGESGGELVPILVLLGFAAIFALIAAWRLRFDQQKTGFA